MAPTSAMGITFNNGNKIRGNKAVTAICTASVIHQITIQIATAITASPVSETKWKGRFKTIKNSMGAKSKPIFFENAISSIKC